MQLPRSSVLAFGVVAALGLSVSLPAAETAPATGRLFISSFMTMHDPFFEDLNAGMKQAVEAHGDRFVLLDGQHSRQKQEQDIINLLPQHPAAIFLVPATDVGSTDGILAAAKKANVPVILVDTDLGNPPGVLCQVLSDNVGAGRIDADALAQVNPHAKIGILSFSLSKGCVDRVNGFKAELAKYPGMTVLDAQDGHANKDGVKGVIAGYLNAHPDMDAIFAINDVSAIAANAGIAAAGREGKITVLGVAGSREGAEAIKEGKMLASAAQRPLEIGRVAVEKAYDHLAGKTVEQNVVVPVELVTKANVDAYLR